MENKSARAKVQAFGGFLTAMVIPNIGAFIAWGFITALFIPTGWLPNEHFAKIVGPMITYLLPVMIGSTGGHLVGGKRGAVMGGIGTIGVDQLPNHTLQSAADRFRTYWDSFADRQPANVACCLTSQSPYDSPDR